MTNQLNHASAAETPAACGCNGCACQPCTCTGCACGCDSCKSECGCAKS